MAVRHIPEIKKHRYTQGWVESTMDALEIYRHYKGKYYTKLYEAQHSETGELLVIYSSCDDGKVYARPKEMFYDTVNKSNFYGPRFYKVERKNLNE